jgi:hypothetical protein
MKNRSTIFTLGNRLSVIQNDLEASVVVPHASIKADQKVLCRKETEIKRNIIF